MMFGGVPVVAVIILTWYGCSFYRYCVNSTDLVAKQKQPFYYAHGFSGSRIQKGHNKDGLSLFHDVWDDNWESLKSGVSQWLKARIL